MEAINFPPAEDPLNGTFQVFPCLSTYTPSLLSYSPVICLIITLGAQVGLFYAQCRVFLNFEIKLGIFCKVKLMLTPSVMYLLRMSGKLSELITSDLATYLNSE